MVSGSPMCQRKERVTFIYSFVRFAAAPGPAKRCRLLARIASAGPGSISASGIFTLSPLGSATGANCWWSRTATLRWAQAICGEFLWRLTPWLTEGKILEEQTLYRTRPDVSPDGKRIVYASTAGAADQFNHLYVLPVEGGHPYKLTFGDHDDFHPRWSPDGESIAYISNEEGLPQLYVLEINGGGKRKIEIRRRHWKQPMSVVRVSVVDEKTGKPSAGAHLGSGLRREIVCASGSLCVQCPARIRAETSLLHKRIV